MVVLARKEEVLEPACLPSIDIFVAVGVHSLDTLVHERCLECNDYNVLIFSVLSNPFLKVPESLSHPANLTSKHRS